MQPVIGFVTATTSTVILYIAQAADSIPAAARGWIEGGGTLGLIGGLSYGCITLWKEIQNGRREMAELNKEIRTDWKAQNEKLISVLERLDTDK
jgi:hypothetical protein